MSPSEAYARLLDLGVATVETADVATALRVTTSAATKLLGKLAATKLIARSGGIGVVTSSTLLGPYRNT